MDTERGIHLSIFVLLLVGLTALAAWGSYILLQSNVLLVAGTTALGWGIILLAMYVSFKKLGWKWWS